MPTDQYSENKVGKHTPDPNNVPSYVIKQEEEQDMADMLSDPTLHTEHAAIRHDIGLAEANIRDTVGREACGINMNIGAARAENERGFADTRYNIATEACGINKHIGDMRQEDAENFGHTRRDLQAGFSDTRREGAEHTNEIIKESIKGDWNVTNAVKDARYDISAKVGAETDRVVDRVTEGTRDLKDRFFTVGRDLADLRQGQVTLAKDVELNALKVQLDAKENTRYLADRIVDENEKTRVLINDLKYHDLNRGLVERNAELVECEADRRHWRHRADQSQFAGQWAQLQSQIQAFQSQLQETRQGLVNFGSMNGNAGQQTSTSNNVR